MLDVFRECADRTFGKPGRLYAEYAIESRQEIFPSDRGGELDELCFVERSRVAKSSGISAGVFTISTARSITILSMSLNAVLVRYRGRSSSCRSVTPISLPTAEPMSIQNGHPTSALVFTRASAFRRLSIRPLASSDISKMFSARSSAGRCRSNASVWGCRLARFMTRITAPSRSMNPMS